jgi:hypothetical protein
MSGRIIVAALLAAIIATPVAAQDANGKWVANIETPQGPFQMNFNFVANGASLTGDMSNEFMGTTPIADGKVDGGNLSFKLTMQGGPNGPMTINYKGSVTGDSMALTSTFEGAPPGGGPAEQQLTLTRAP